ncbi:MAG: hypothetical protein GY746_07365 [Gammaproteobacteria bacterium]|nr:hypothetical protein [Gammaproteobacteria bacterium]
MKKLIIAMAAFGLSSVAMAGPSWTYAELDAVFQDDGDDKAKGYEIAGSLAFGGLFHVNAEYADIDDGAGADNDLDGYRIAAGIHPAVTDSTDLYAELGYTSLSEDNGQDPDAIDLTFGVRSMITDSVELGAAMRLANGSTDAGGADDFQDSEISLSGQYFFTDALAFRAEASDNSMELGVRWSFGDIL